MMPWNQVEGGPKAKRFVLGAGGIWKCYVQTQHGWISSRGVNKLTSLTTPEVLEYYKEAQEIFARISENEQGKVQSPWLFTLEEDEGIAADAALQSLYKEAVALANAKRSQSHLPVNKSNDDIIYL